MNDNETTKESLEAARSITFGPILTAQQEDGRYFSSFRGDAIAVALAPILDRVARDAAREAVLTCRNLPNGADADIIELAAASALRGAKGGA